MKRIPGKIKDFVEAQAFDAIGNYAADPSRALAAYRFTEATADLLARWLDALADMPRTNLRSAGAPSKQHCRAIAGPRGAGKSHTLAALGALVAHTELRHTPDDAQVATSARRLGTRQYTLLRVERGTHPTLEEEIRAALDKVFGAGFSQSAPGGQLSGKAERFASLLAFAAARVHDAPFVFIIDTAYGRGERVARDDGADLSELAAAARSVGAFVLLALDDDIAGADGANVALAHFFQIEYLDPEHLFRVAETHVLRKTPTGRAALREIYTALRGSVPGFNWSETRFSALYPLHPIVADIAPSVRLYSQSFALLPFAADATQKAAGRPPSSLITLDEVFDRAEHDLRRSPRLADAFAAYDDLNTRAVSQLPIMARLRARLVLKVLFILSLDNRAPTVEEICAAMLFGDETAGGSLRDEEEALMLFAALQTADGRSSPVERYTDDGKARYRFLLNAAESFANALRAATEEIELDKTALNRLLCGIAHRRFADFPLVANSGSSGETSEMFVPWRGTHRAGQFLIASRDGATAPEAADVTAVPNEAEAIATKVTPRIEADCNSYTEARVFEWRVTMLPASYTEDAERDAELRRAVEDSGRSHSPARLSFVWRPARCANEELTSLRRFAALNQNGRLLEEFGEQAHAALAESAAEAERAWSRLYLEEGEVISADDEASNARSLSAEVRRAPTLALALAATLDSAFAALYAAHPVFGEPLGEREVARLATNLFGGVNTSDAQTQRDAELFASPLRLVVRRDQLFALATNVELLKQTSVQTVLQRVIAAGGRATSLVAVNDVLGVAPFGLTSDAQRLLLTALVANRQLEFVTSTGERLGRRALGASLKWTEITGVVRAGGITTSVEELTAWGRLLTTSTPQAGRVDAETIAAEFARSKAAGSISNPDTREELRRDMTEWFAAWRGEDVFGRCERLPDRWLTIRNATHLQAARRTFGVAATAIESWLGEDIEMEEALQRVADAFAGSTATFADAAARLDQLTRSAKGFVAQDERRRYLSAIEPLPGMPLEEKRRRLLASADDEQNSTDDDASFEKLWIEFHEQYVEHYTARHTAQFTSDDEQRLLDQLSRGEVWREIEALAELPSLGDERYRRLLDALRQHEEARCLFAPDEVRAALLTQPVCVCGFRLTSRANPVEIARDLQAAASVELDAYRRSLTRLAAHLAEALDLYAGQPETDAASRADALRLATTFAAGGVPEGLTGRDVRIMREAVEAVTSPQPLRIEFPISRRELLTPAELDARVRQWLDELPSEMPVVEIAEEPIAPHAAPVAV